MKIKSPLRYPGGKSKAIRQILPLVPQFQEYREPLVGGGSVFIELKQIYPERRYWINDLNEDLYLFWKFARDHNAALVERVRQIKRTTLSGRDLFNAYQDNWDRLDEFERAVRFFVLNRITFSGIIDSGGYSEQSFRNRFTESSIERLARLKEILRDVKITNLDYEAVVLEPGEGVFIFLDPPYYSTTQSRLYGKNGDLHVEFDHQRFAGVMRKCPHLWLITYDDVPEIRQLFDFAHIKPWSLQYGMNNYKQEKAGIGNEIFIANFPLESGKLDTKGANFQLSFMNRLD